MVEWETGEITEEPLSLIAADDPLLHVLNMPRNMTSSTWMPGKVTHFYQCLRLCSCGTKPQRSKNHHSVMMSSWEPQCHHDIIMRTPRIMGKPRFSCSRGP